MSVSLANLITILVFISIPAVGFEIFIEGKGSSIYHSIMHDEPNTSIAKDTIYKYIQAPAEFNDFTIRKTPVYSRSSIKTKQVGSFEPGTSLYIIKITKGWCFVEGKAFVTKNSTRKNRKKYRTKEAPIKVEKVVKGWVKKDALDMFQ